MDNDFMESGDTGKPAAIGFRFLYIAFAVGRPHDNGIISRHTRGPLHSPKGPREMAAGIVNVGIPPSRTVIEAKFHAGNPAVAAVSADTSGVRKRRSLIEQIAQRKTFPDSVADETRVQPIADTHQCRFLLGRWKSSQILEAPFRPILHEPNNFEVPKIDIYARIDHVLGHAIKQIVRRNRLDAVTLVLRPIVTKSRCTIKFARQSDAATGESDSNCAQHKCASPDCWSKFSVFGRDFWSREKLKAANEYSLENENAERETDERHQAGSFKGHSYIACAQNRPKRDSEHNDRQDNKDRDRANRRVPRWIAPHEQTENCTADRAYEELTGD